MAFAGRINYPRKIRMDHEESPVASRPCVAEIQYTKDKPRVRRAGSRQLYTIKVPVAESAALGAQACTSSRARAGSPGGFLTIIEG